jgi:4'-phosphopantetheinyl transferase
MSLASALLKRAYIAKVTGLRWSQIEFTKRGHPIHGKPCWLPPSEGEWPMVDFNVSHQAGIATLVGIVAANGYASQDSEDHCLVGCDIVMPHERSDFASIQASDFEDYTETYCEVFSPEELFDITYTLPSNSVTLLNGERLSADTLGRHDRAITLDQPMSATLPDGRVEEFTSDLIIDAKLRRFYTFFCLKEAYIKLVGEGLLAPWIKECEFRNVHAPTPGSSTQGAWGGRTSGGRSFVSKMLNTPRIDEAENMEIWLNGEEVHDVITEVQAFEEDYMIATMIKPGAFLGPKAEFPPWTTPNLEREALGVANRDAIQTAIEAMKF